MLLLRTKWDWRRVRGHDPHALMLDPINWRHCSAVYRPFLLGSGALHQDVRGKEATPSFSSQYAQVSTNHVTRHEPIPTRVYATRVLSSALRDSANAEMTCFCCLCNLTDIRLLTPYGKHIYHLTACNIKNRGTSTRYTDVFPRLAATNFPVIFFLLSDFPPFDSYMRMFRDTLSLPSSRRCKREYPASTACEDETYRVFREVGIQISDA